MPRKPAAAKRAMCVRDLVTAIESIAPTRLAAEWDNVGLLAGDPGWRLRSALLTIDLTPDALDEAVGRRVGAIVSYHPPIFRAIKSLRVGRDSTEGLAAEALSRRIAVYSPHTALDAADGGMNDTIAAMCGAKRTRPFTFAPALAEPECKVVVFVPANAVDRVAGAIFENGAGRIGDYTHCSFRSPGQGTFFGTESTDPAVGRRGRLERVDEIRLEAVAPRSRMSAIVTAIRAAHPYEVPAIDLFPLEAIPSRKTGQGRLGALPRAIRAGDLARRLKRATRAANVLIVGGPKTHVERVLVCVGSAGSLPFEMDGETCRAGDAVVTGEIRHHDARRYERAGVVAIALGHWASERPGLEAFARRLSKLLPGVSLQLSRRDADPFRAA